MEALILSCGTGGGHNSACAAIGEALSEKGHRVRTLDPYLLRGKKTAEAVSSAYILLAQKAPSAFGAVYHLGDAYRHLPVPSPVYGLNRLMVPLLEEYLRQDPPDVIVTTHLFPAEILTSMKRQGKPLPPTVFVATDYTCIPFTEETDCDLYVIPAPELTDEFASRGIPRDRILPLGIPVRRAFREGMDREEARASLGIDPAERCILIAGGSIGAGQIGEIVPLLLERYGDSARPVVVCGNNESLYRRMSRDFGQRCTVLRFTERMAAYMAACDLFLSKPGGLSSTEAAVLGVPLIHVAPIPGCETHNMAFFERHGMSLAVHDVKTELIPACDALLIPSRRQEMLERQRETLPADAAPHICELCCASCVPERGRTGR